MSNRHYTVWTKGNRPGTEKRVVADNKANALASYAFPLGLKTIHCDAVFIPAWKRGVGRRA